MLDHLQRETSTRQRGSRASHEGLNARPSQNAARVSAILAWFERYKASALPLTTAR